MLILVSTTASSRIIILAKYAVSQLIVMIGAMATNRRLFTAMPTGATNERHEERYIGRR